MASPESFYSCAMLRDNFVIKKNQPRGREKPTQGREKYIEENRETNIVGENIQEGGKKLMGGAEKHIKRGQRRTQV